MNERDTAILIVLASLVGAAFGLFGVFVVAIAVLIAIYRN